MKHSGFTGLGSLDANDVEKELIFAFICRSVSLSDQEKVIISRLLFEFGTVSASWAFKRLHQLRFN